MIEQRSFLVSTPPKPVFGSKKSKIKMAWLGESGMWKISAQATDDHGVLLLEHKETSGERIDLSGSVNPADESNP